MPGGPAIECVTLKEGPPGIETPGPCRAGRRPDRRHGEEARQRLLGLRHRLLLRSRPACRARDHDQAGARHRRVRHPDRADAGPALRRDLDPAEIDPAPPALCRPDGRERPHGRRPRDRPGRRRARQRGDAPSPAWPRSPPSCATRTAPTCWSWAAPAWRAIATACSAMSACRWSSPARRRSSMAIGRSRLGWSA